MTNELVCLGRFKHHSLYPWYWDRVKELYLQECSLSGCSFAEVSESLTPVGQTSITGEIAGHEHDWASWVCMSDVFGIRTHAVYRYKRKCGVCKAEEMAVNLEVPDEG